MDKKIGVVGLAGAWSTEELANAVEAKTGYRQIIDLAEVTLDSSAGKVFYKDDDLTSYDALIIKKAGETYSSDLLDRLEILCYLESKGVRIFSRPAKILRLLDRLSCTVTLLSNKVPMPPTVITENETKAIEAIGTFGEAVLKPLYSTKARGMILLSAGNGMLDELREFRKQGNKTFYIQKKLNLPGRDMGLVFLGGKFVDAYSRVAGKGSWNTTIQSGGRYEPCKPSSKIIEMAKRAQSLFELDFTCVDVVETDMGAVVFEVSAFGGFKGLQKACGINAAELLVDYVMESLFKNDKS